MLFPVDRGFVRPVSARFSAESSLHAGSFLCRWWLAALVALLAVSPGPAAAGAETRGVALVRRGGPLNGTIEGSLHVLTAETVTLNGGVRISGDLLVPGTPPVVLNGRAVVVSTFDGPGQAEPRSHRIVLNGRARLGHVIRRTDPVPLEPVPASPPPPGTRFVTLNRPADSALDFATLRHLTLNGQVGEVAVPPGSYGTFLANGGSSFVLGSETASEPQAYHFQRLMLNGSAALRIAGPVIVTIGEGLTLNGAAGSEEHPEWLTLLLRSGSFTLHGGARMGGFVHAPASTVTLDGGSRLTGGLAADRLVLNGNARLRLVPPPDDGEEPPTVDADADGIDDAWEQEYGLNPTVDDGANDADGDGVSNLEEFQRRLRPDRADSDGDDLYDGDELELGLDPAAPTPDPEPPTAPTTLTAAITANGGVMLSWEAATDNLRVAGYIIYRDGDPLDTDDAIRATSFTDVDVLPGDEITYEVRAFDFAGNLSELSAEQTIRIPPLDEDGDAVPDEWERRYFEGEDADANADPDGDGITTRDEYRASTDPQDFYNGIKPLLESVPQSELNDPNQVATRVLRPDGTPWPGAPITFTIDEGRRRISATPGGPDFGFRAAARAGPDGIARVYLEPIAP